MGGEMREACGVVGIIGTKDAPELAVTGLYALQHRGQESAGVAYSAEGKIRVEKAMGLVAEVFTSERLERMTGSAAIGHVRYSTSGSSKVENAQPLVFRSRFGPFAIGHNGNLVNAYGVRKRLEGEGAIFQTTTDTEVIAHLIARSRRHSLEDALKEALGILRGGYALVVLTRDAVLGVRDPAGLRPLVVGRMGGAPAVASESPAFSAAGGSLENDVRPGELVRLTAKGVLRKPAYLPKGPEALCSFEYIYFARPDAVMDEKTVLSVRRRLGEELAREAPAPADIVVGVPDSSIPAAEGYARTLGLPLESGLAKNRYIGRTFIQPTREGRTSAVQIKLAAVGEVVAGKRVALVDDSIVRGTTARHIVGLLRSAGAREVHLRIASPPYRHPCHYGIDTSNRKELLASGLSLDDIARETDAESLMFLSEEGVRRAIGSPTCMACFTGSYPIPIEGAQTKEALETEAQEL